MEGFATGIDVRESLAYVATGKGFAVVDLNEKKPVRFIDTFRHCETLRVYRDLLLFASKQYIVCYRLAEGSSEKLWEASSFDPFYFSHNIEFVVENGVTYTASMEGRLYVWQIEEEGAKALCQFSFWGTREELTEQKKIEYVLSTGLVKSRRKARRFIPKYLNYYIIATGIAKDDRLVYILDRDGKLWILDVSLEPRPGVALRATYRKPEK